MITIKVNLDDAIRGVGRMTSSFDDTTDLMADLADRLASESERQFKQESGPLGKWPMLTHTSQRLRQKAGTWPGKMLDVHAGGLAPSVQVSHTRRTASIFSNKPYAAIQHFGGTTSPRSMIPNKRIPARPFLPFNPVTGELSDPAKSSVQETLDAWLNQLRK